MSLKVAPEKVDVSDERTRSRRDFQIVVAAAWKEAEPSHAFPVNLGLGRSLSSENKKQLKQLCIAGSAPGTPCTMDLSSLRPPPSSSYSAPIGERSIVMSVSVCMCVFVRDHIFRSTRPMFTNFLCMLPIAVARSSIYDSDVTYDLTLVIYPTITLKKQVHL